MEDFPCELPVKCSFSYLFQTNKLVGTEDPEVALRALFSDSELTKVLLASKDREVSIGQILTLFVFMNAKIDCYLVNIGTWCWSCYICLSMQQITEGLKVSVCLTC